MQPSYGTPSSNRTFELLKEIADVGAMEIECCDENAKCLIREIEKSAGNLTGAVRNSRAICLIKKMNEIPSGYVEVREGSAAIINKEGEVFYNKVQCVNRDLSIAVIKTFLHQRQLEFEAKALKSSLKRKAMTPEAKEDKPNEEIPATSSVEVQDEKTKAPGIRILEALSATGLRSIRYWKEIPKEEGDIASILANDIDPAAVEAIRRNITHNNISLNHILPNEADACVVMHGHKNPSEQFDVVDVDPYGSAGLFLDSAVQAVNDGGLLAITCTDKAVLCGNNSEVCFAKYGSVSLRGSYCHEMAVRIVLASIASAAARHKRYIVPVLSLSIDFYVRVFVRVYTSALEVKKSGNKVSYVYQCVSCESFVFQPTIRVVQRENSTKYQPGSGPAVDRNCGICGKAQRMGGPIWTNPLHDREWIKLTLQEVQGISAKYATADRLQAMLTLALEELPDCPLYYTLPSICRVLNLGPFKQWIFRAALLNAGYQVSQAHSAADAVKTSAPTEVVWDIMRCYMRDKQKPVKEPPANSSCAAIMAKEPTLKADFSKCRGADVSTAARKNAGAVAKFLPNPEENWGPKARASSKRKTDDMSQEEKSRANQGKRRRKAKPCFVFQETGQCPRGENCKFLHQPKEVEQNADAKMDTTTTTVDQSSALP